MAVAAQLASEISRRFDLSGFGTGFWQIAIVFRHLSRNHELLKFCDIYPPGVKMSSVYTGLVGGVWRERGKITELFEGNTMYTHEPLVAPKGVGGGGRGCSRNVHLLFPVCPPVQLLLGPAPCVIISN